MNSMDYQNSADMVFTCATSVKSANVKDLSHSDVTTIQNTHKHKHTAYHQRKCSFFASLSLPRSLFLLDSARSALDDWKPTKNYPLKNSHTNSLNGNFFSFSSQKKSNTLKVELNSHTRMPTDSKNRCCFALYTRSEFSVLYLDEISTLEHIIFFSFRFVSFVCLHFSRLSNNF